MSDPRIVEIAEGLSGAQRMDVIRSRRDGYGYKVPTGSGRGLIPAGCAYRHIGVLFLTETGLAVRKYLQEQSE